MDSTSTGSSVEERKPPHLLGGLIIALGLLVTLGGVGMVLLMGMPLVLICGLLITAGGVFTYKGRKLGLFLHLAGMLPMFGFSLIVGGVTGSFVAGLLIHGVLIFFTVRDVFLRD